MLMLDGEGVIESSVLSRWTGILAFGSITDITLAIAILYSFIRTATVNACFILAFREAKEDANEDRNERL